MRNHTLSFIILSLIFSTCIWSNSQPIQVISLDSTEYSNILDVDITHDGKRMIIIDYASQDNIPSLWDIESGQKILEYSYPSFTKMRKARGSTISNNGKYVAIYGEPYYCTVFELETGKEVFSYKTIETYDPIYGLAHVTSACFSADDRYLFLSDWTHRYYLVNVNDGTLEKGSRIFLGGGPIYWTTFMTSVTNDIVFMKGKGLVNIKNFEILSNSLSSYPVLITPNKQKLIYMDDDYTINVWNINDKKIELTYQFQNVDFQLIDVNNNLQIISGGKVFDTGNRNRILFDIKQNKILGIWPKSKEAQKNDPQSTDSIVGFFPDNTKYFTGNGSNVYIYDISNLTSSIKNPFQY